MVFSQNSVLVPDYGNTITVYNKYRYFNTNKKVYIYNHEESGVGEMVLNRSHNWLQYWRTSPIDGNYGNVWDYGEAAQYTIPQDGYVNFTYAMSSFYTTEVLPWVGYDATKTASFAVWLARDGNVVQLYARSGNAGEFSDEQLTPVAQGDVLYYGVLNKGDQLPASAKIKFYPAKLKKIS